MKEHNILKIQKRYKINQNNLKKSCWKKRSLKIIIGSVIGTLLLIFLIGSFCYFYIEPIIKIQKISRINSKELFLHIKLNELVVNKNELPENIKAKNNFIQKLYQIEQSIQYFKKYNLTFIIISDDDIFKNNLLLDIYKAEITKFIKIANLNEIKITVGISHVLTAHTYNILKLLEFDFYGICGIQPEKEEFMYYDIKNSEAYKLFTQSYLYKYYRTFGIEDQYFYSMTLNEYYKSNVGFFLVNKNNIDISNIFIISNKPKIVLPSIKIKIT